jgi:hypothetical protein
MLTFTHTVDALPNCPDMHSYKLVGSYIDSEGSSVQVGEYTTNLPRILKALEYYLKDVADIEVVFQTVVSKG